MIVRPTLLLLLLILPFYAVGSGSSEKPWSVRIKGTSEKIAFMKKRAQLKLSRTTNFCIGFNMPMPTTKWKCTKDKNGKNICSIKYKCQAVNKKFNRKTEASKYLEELKAMKKKYSSNFKIYVAKDYISGGLRTLSLKKSETNYVPDIRKETRYDFKEKLPAEEATAYHVEKSLNYDGNATVYTVTKKDESERTKKLKKFYWALFRGALTKVSDNNENSVATTDIAWTPTRRYGDRWHLRGHFGGHLLKSEISIGSETYMVYDFAVLAGVNLFNNYFLALGPGIQRWAGKEKTGSHGTLHLEGGYKFSRRKMKWINSMFISTTSVNSKNSNKELKLGIGIAF